MGLPPLLDGADHMRLIKDTAGEAAKDCGEEGIMAGVPEASLEILLCPTELFAVITK
jgi:hypothetical protein